MADDHDLSIYHEVLGGAELLRWFGEVPSFHDAEILSLDLRRKGPSVLRVHSWIMTATGDERRFVSDRHAVVSFTLDEIMDLQLDGFSAQNVIFGLILRRAPDRPERRDCLASRPSPDDIEIELEPCYGLDGYIRARSVAISFKPGEPAVEDACRPGSARMRPARSF